MPSKVAALLEVLRAEPVACVVNGQVLADSIVIPAKAATLIADLIESTDEEMQRGG